MAGAVTVDSRSRDSPGPQGIINLTLPSEKFGNTVISQSKYSPVFGKIKRGHLRLRTQSLPSTTPAVGKAHQGQAGFEGNNSLYFRNDHDRTYKNTT